MGLYYSHAHFPTSAYNNPENMLIVSINLCLAQMFSLFRVEGHYAEVQVIHFPRCLSCTEQRTSVPSAQLLTARCVHGLVFKW